MIIGRTQSADGGFRRIPIRHTQIVDKESREKMVSYLKDVLYKNCKKSDWVGASDIFSNIPDDIANTPLMVIYNICSERFKDTPQSIKINVFKYIGMLVREAAYYSDERYYEQLIGSVRKYSLESKKLLNINIEENRKKILEGFYKK